MTIRTLSIFIFLFIFSFSAISDVIEEYSVTKKDLNQVKKEISKESKELASIKSTKKSLLKNLKRIEAKIYEQERQLAKINKKIRKLKLKQKDIIREITKTQRVIDNMKESIRKSNIYLINNKGMIELKILLFSKTYYDTVKNMEIIKRINKEIYKEILIIKKEQDKILKLKNDLDSKITEIKKINKMKKILIDEYNAEKIRYKQTLNLVKNDEEDTKEYLNMLIARKKELEKSFNKARKKIYKQEGGDEILKSRFLKAKGHIMWPIDGTVIEYFGPKKVKGFKGTIYNKGIKIKADDTGYVFAVFDGTVKYVDQVRGYGNIVIINHDRFFYTLYANLDEVFVNTDQKVKKGEKIGLIDVDLNKIKPYLYFEIRKQEKAVNPLNWLEK
jgi:septal ring factor EnvC (AmiA/AmiB activator)